jgi:signal peptide peptidase SppA
MLVRILHELVSTPWAIRAQDLEMMVSIAQREWTDERIEALAARNGKPLDNTGGDVEIRDGVAIFSIRGPMIHYATVFSSVSGATSYETVSLDFTKALENPAVHSILLDIDSPGGAFDGMSELAARVFEARAVKPVVAYVGGLAASAAYWLAAATEKIYVTDGAQVGSVGAVMRLRDSREADAKAGYQTFEFVSSQSPRKAIDPATDEGRAQIQQIVDDAGSLFVEKLAAYRNTEATTLMKRYGKGGVLSAKRALDAGMVDQISTFEAVVAELRQAQEARMETATIALEQTAQQVRTEERTRILAILNSPEAERRRAVAQEIACTTDLTVEAAIRVLAKAPVESSLSAAMDEAPNPKVGPAREADTGEDEVAAILRFVPQRAGQERR